MGHRTRTLVFDLRAEEVWAEEPTLLQITQLGTVQRFKRNREIKGWLEEVEVTVNYVEGG